MLRVIAHHNFTTPVEAEGEFSFTIRNDGNADVKIVQFPRFASFYFQRLEILDNNGRMLEILKESDSRCGRGLICIVLREPLKPRDQITLRFRYIRSSHVSEKQLRGFFIQRTALPLVHFVDEGTSVYVDVLPPEGMRLKVVEHAFTPFTPLVDTEKTKGYPIATPEKGCRRVSYRFPESGGSPLPGAYVIIVDVRYPSSLSWTIISLPFATILLFLSVVLRRLLCFPLPLVPPSFFLALFGALLGVRIWTFSELLMRRLSYLYVAGTILSLIGAILAIL